VPEWYGLGKVLIVAGAVLVLFGLSVLLLGRIPGAGSGGTSFGWLGKLPGDIEIKRDGFSFYAPITTCLLISLVLSLIYYFVSSVWRR